VNVGFFSEALPYLPCREGFRIYAANIVRTLSPRHQIDLLSLITPGDPAHLDWPADYCRSVRTVSTRSHPVPARVANLLSSYGRGRPRHYRGDILSRLRDGCRAQHWDVLHVEGSFAGGLVPDDLPIPAVLSVHDSSTLRWRELRRCAVGLRTRLRCWALERHARRYERLVYPRFDRCVVVAKADRDELRRVAPGARVEVIPNGTDTDYFRPIPGERKPDALVFHGSLSFPPNVHGAVEFADQIFPLVRREVPGATFRMVGAAPSASVRALTSRPGVALSADLPDLREPLSTSHVYVCAIRHGGGVKNKILEALALRLPVVCYPEAIAGIDCRAGTHLLVADSRVQFARHVVALLKDPSLCARLGDAGRRLMEQSYSWEARARDYERLYAEIREERRSRAPATVASPGEKITR
jgi:glycosyltransferase involved in cell wall biosynthesis